MARCSRTRTERPGRSNFDTVQLTDRIQTLSCKSESPHLILLDTNLNIAGRGGSQALEIRNIVRIAAIQVVRKLVVYPGVVIGGISDRNLSITLLSDIRLRISHRGLHERQSVARLQSIGHLVTRKEAQHIRIVLERVDNRGVPLIQPIIPLWHLSINDLALATAQRRKHVYPRRRKLRHALRVVLRWIDGVRAHHVDA